MWWSGLKGGGIEAFAGAGFKAGSWGWVNGVAHGDDPVAFQHTAGGCVLEYGGEPFGLLLGHSEEAAYVPISAHSHTLPEGSSHHELKAFPRSSGLGFDVDRQPSKAETHGCGYRHGEWLCDALEASDSPRHSGGWEPEASAHPAYVTPTPSIRPDGTHNI